MDGGRSHKVTRMLLKATMVLLLALIVAMVGFEGVNATQYTVGDTVGWGLGNNLGSWASQFKFHVGDDLYFPYPAGQHSVLLVTEDDYNSCNIESPITSDNGMGDMVMTLVSAETYFFICGVPGHCTQGLRLSIAVEPDTPSTNDSAPPPPDAVAHNPPPQHAPDVLTPPEAPPAADDTVAPALSPPYYTKYNSFHRNSAASLHMSILAYSTTIILAIASTLFML
eukprot:c20245_g1_i1 orf=292-966(-)